MIRAALVAALTVAGSGAAAGADVAPVWRLVEIDGHPAEGLELTIAPDGAIAGQAPCNRFVTRNRGTLPAFDLAPIGATQMACDRLAGEGALLALLATMRRAEIAGLALVLTGPGGRTMRFARPLY